MGIWDELRSPVVKLFNRNISGAPPEKNETRYYYNTGVSKAVTQIGDAFIFNGAEKLKEYFPDTDRREKIGRILSNLGTFAVDSAINESLKGVTGGIQVYKIVKEGLKDQPPLPSSNENNKPDPTVAMEEMHARMEKMEEAMNHIKKQTKISIQSTKGSEPSKEFADEPVKGSAPLKSDQKRVFIRSRL